MVKVQKIAAYQVGGHLFTDRGKAETAARREVLHEILKEEVSWGGIVDALDVADALCKHWDDINRKMTEAFRGIS